jgi:cellulose synthase/poly-beta-1,6-N-acetylglucosamine synthase-like glycosyltransferase
MQHWRMASPVDDRDVGHALPEVMDVIRDAGLATPDEIAGAVAASAASGSRPEMHLLAAGTVGLRPLSRALADAWGVPFCDLDRTPFDHELVHRFDPAALVRDGWFPVRHADGEPVIVATANPPTVAWQSELERTIGAPVELHATTEWDVQNGVLQAFRTHILDEASLGLWNRDADRSARVVLTAPQTVGFLALLIVTVASAVLWPTVTLSVIVTLVSFGFLVSVLFKFVVCFVGARLEQIDPISRDDIAGLEPADLPSYTVLVPVYKEANVVADLVGNLAALDYPHEKLQILLLLEEDDHETIEAAKAARPPATITFRIVPRGQPQTKPKACNVGLFFARGDYLVIYDAEDQPDPDQLKQAVIAFRRGGDDIACVQAALNYWNVDENALTRMFTLEYSFWFDYMLPGLDAMGLPIPLGGTSNHFRTDALRQLGGWDPFNVTEDADLGIRASAMGSRVGVIRSTTYEEANRAYGNFVRQRSRWIKGYMQTALVHLRHPIELTRTVGWRSAAAFGLLIGGTPLAFLFTPPLLALLIASIVSDPEELSRYMPGWVLWAGLTNLLVGNALMIYVSMMGAFRRRYYRLVPWALLNPLYWLLHALASYKALWQLITKPHFWEKTEHGLSEVRGKTAVGDGGKSR